MHATPDRHRRTALIAGALAAGLVLAVLAITVAGELSRRGSTVAGDPSSSTPLASQPTAPTRGRSAGASTSDPSPPPPSDATATTAVIAALERRVAATPDDVDAYAELGLAYLQRVRESGDPSDYGRAETAFRETLRRDPRHLEALIGKGALALARHEFRDALQIGEQARRLAPDDSRVYAVIGDAQVELGMYEDAVRTIQTMVDLKPDISSYSRVSYLRELHGQVEPAIDAMEDAFQAGAGALENREYVRVQIGHLFFNKGDLATAERVFQASLEAYPGYIHAQGGLARVRAAQGRWDESIEWYQRAIARIPLLEFVVALGETQEAAGRLDDAARTYDLVRAIEQLLTANGVNTDLEVALFEADHGSTAEAVELARAAYEEQPNIKAADALAWALHRAGRSVEALPYAEEALRLGTKDALFLYHAGMIALEAGKRDEARDHLSRALAINPHFSALHAPTARRVLAELGAASPPTP